MIKIIAEKFIKEESQAEVNALYAELSKAAEQEVGCVSYQLFVNEEDSTHYVMIEEWVDQACLDAHFATEHFKRIIPQINALAQPEKRVLSLKPRFEDEE